MTDFFIKIVGWTLGWAVVFGFLLFLNADRDVLLVQSGLYFGGLAGIFGCWYQCKQEEKVTK